MSAPLLALGVLLGAGLTAFVWVWVTSPPRGTDSTAITRVDQ